MPSERFVVGICGPTSSGKTTLGEHVANVYKPDIAVLRFDEYDLYPSGSELLERALADGRIVNWEDPELFDWQAFMRDLSKLRDGLPVVLETRSRESMAEQVAGRRIDPQKLILTEEIFRCSFA